MKHTLSKKELDLLKELRKSFSTKGYSPSIRALQEALGYKSPRSITVLLGRMKDKGLIERDDKTGDLRIVENMSGDTTANKTIDLPLVGNISCGSPILAEQNVKEIIPVDVVIARPPHKYFLLTAQGDSMNKKGINDGDILVVKIQQTAIDGDRVVAVINDEATVKEFRRSGNYIVLKPHSTNPAHKPMILTENLIIQGVVVSVIPKV